jgi:hypothetical protein
MMALERLDGDKPVTTEYQEFEKWWEEYVKQLNQRATLVWQEIAWAGWFARSEVAEKKRPSVWKRKGPSE